MSMIRPLPAALQEFFGPLAEQHAHTTGMIARRRGYNATEFLTTVVFGYLHDSQATLASLAEELDLSDAALHQCFA